MRDGATYMYHCKGGFLYYAVGHTRVLRLPELCSGYIAGVEATIHAATVAFSEIIAEGVLLVDAFKALKT